MIETIRNEKNLWDIYTRKEEYGAATLDRYRRYANKMCITEPLVSQYLKSCGYTFEYPDNKRFALCLTHDIDDIYVWPSFLIKYYFDSVKNLDLSEAINGIRSRSTLLNNFTGIMDLEDRYDARSSFYFLSTDRDVRRYRY